MTSRSNAGKLLAVSAVTLLGLAFINTSAVSADSSAYGTPYPSRDMVNVVPNLIPGQVPAYVTFPQIEADGNVVPTCTPTGIVEYQVEHLKYGTDQEKKTTDNLIDVVKGLQNRDSDKSVQMSGGYLVVPPKCATGGMGGDTTPTTPSTPQVLSDTTTAPAAAQLSDTGLNTWVASTIAAVTMASAIFVSRKKAAVTNEA